MHVVYHLCAWCWQKLEEGIDPGTGVTDVCGYHGNAGHRTRFSVRAAGAPDRGASSPAPRHDLFMCIIVSNFSGSINVK